MTEDGSAGLQLMVPITVGAALGLVVEVAALFLSFLSSGGGHGDYAAARALFPLPMLTTLLEGDTIGPLSMALALIQFPFLGALGGYCVTHARWAPLIAAGAGHVAAMIAAFSGIILNFS